MGCSVWHSRRKDNGPAYLEYALVAGKGLGKDRTNGAAARPAAGAREGRAREESPREGKGRARKEVNLRPLSAAEAPENGRAVNEPSSSEPAT